MICLHRKHYSCLGRLWRNYNIIWMVIFLIALYDWHIEILDDFGRWVESLEHYLSYQALEHLNLGIFSDFDTLSRTQKAIWSYWKVFVWYPSGFEFFQGLDPKYHRNTSLYNAFKAVILGTSVSPTFRILFHSIVWTWWSILTQVYLMFMVDEKYHVNFSVTLDLVMWYWLHGLVLWGQWEDRTPSVVFLLGKRCQTFDIPSKYWLWWLA